MSDSSIICVSIGRGRHKHMIAEHRHLVEQGARLVELRLDYITRDVNLKRLVGERPCPVIITCRREQDGGKWAGTEQARVMLLRSAVAEGVDYVDIEEDVAADIPRFGKTKRIISYHNFRHTPENLEEIAAGMAQHDPDIIKLATMANSPHDNVRMLELIKSSGVPTVGMCMGEIGTPSRLLAGCFGSPFTYATFHHERTLAPGQLSYRQMVDTYRYDQKNAQTAIFGVVADPVGHSLSPIIHNAAFHHAGLNNLYVPFRVPREHLDEFLDDCPRLGVRGLSVTIPHKEAVIRRCVKVDGAVRGIGAANTLVFTPEGMIGFNTDYRAAMDSLDQAIGAPAGDLPLTGKTALVLGAGGVAKAVVFGLIRRGARVVIASRTAERTAQLAQRFGAVGIDWRARHDETPHVLVNCTPVGMHPNVDETPFDKNALSPTMIVFDTVYNPEQTLLVKASRQARCTVITGVDMFLRQAALQYHHFTGQPAPLDVMLGELRRTVGPAKR